eukprot:scaffold1414_cov102-Isochrysis_galbana.AAC.2
MAPGGAGATGARASGGGVTCLACRLSKVKCERHPGDVACTRCDRLGLVCTSSGVKKRGAQNVKRDVARLGPAVRSLLANGAGIEASMPASALTCASYRFDGAPVEWCGPRCPAMLMSQIESPIGRQALLQHWICIALRSGSCAILGNVLLLAHLGGLTLDKVQALACDSSAVVPTESIHTPDFVSEWQLLPSPVFTRTQVNGNIEFLPNQRFEQAIGNLKEMVARLAPAPGALVTETEPQVQQPNHPRQSPVFPGAPHTDPPQPPVEPFPRSMNQCPCPIPAPLCRWSPPPTASWLASPLPAAPTLSPRATAPTPPR